VTTGSSPDEDLDVAPDVAPDVIERLDAGEPPRSPEEAQARAPYETLLERIQDLDEIAPPPGWEDRAVARWSRARRKRRLGVGIALGATTAVAVAAVLLLQPCGAPAAARLEIAVLTDRGSTYRGDAAVGEVLRTRARVDRPHVDLRIYLGTRLIARCPGSDPCRRDASVVELDWKLVEPGPYQIILLSSSSNIPAGDGTIDRDLLDARGAGASIDIRRVSVAP
jgi:hypothetical protein